MRTLRGLLTLLATGATVIACDRDRALPTTPGTEAISVNADVNAAAVQWELTILPLLPGGTWSEATAINDFGTVIGFGDVASGDVHAFKFRNGIIEDIGARPGYINTRALGINAKGEIVGVGNTTARPRVNTAIIWSQAGLISPLPGTGSVRGSIARDINASGMVAGSFRTALGNWHASRWTSVGMEDLDAALPAGRNSEARAVNDAGHIVGFGDYYTTWSLYSGIRWDTQMNRTYLYGTNNGVVYADSSEAYDINNSGQWVAWSSEPITGYGSGYATWFEAEYHPPGSGTVGSHEVAFSDKQRIVGTLRLDNGRIRAFTNAYFSDTDGYGEMFPLPFPYTNSKGVGVNTCGRVVGWVRAFNAHETRAVMWRRWTRGRPDRVYPCD
jgi:probable HAF family extracellular repeat protein